MKIKWTTITEDESTWPNVDSFLLNDSKETTQWVKVFERFKDLSTQTFWSIGGMLKWKWRPMPKPPKKKKPKSPWKSVLENPPPEHMLDGDVVLVRERYRDKDGINWKYDVEYAAYLENTEWHEWMEIPE